MGVRGHTYYNSAYDFGVYGSYGPSLASPLSYGYLGGNSIGVYGSSSVASGTNYGLFATATGGTTNYAGWFDAGNVIVNTGMLGIGTNVPGKLLDINAGVLSNSAARITSSGNDAAFALKNTGSGGRTYWMDAGSGTAGVGKGNFAIWDETAGAARFAIDSTGNVGIGTTTPSSQLNVVSADQVVANFDYTAHELCKLESKKYIIRAYRSTASWNHF